MRFGFHLIQNELILIIPHSKLSQSPTEDDGGLLSLPLELGAALVGPALPDGGGRTAGRRGSRRRGRRGPHRLRRRWWQLKG